MLTCRIELIENLPVLNISVFKEKEKLFSDVIVPEYSLLIELMAG